MDINDNTMEVRCFLYSCILLLGLGGEVVSAQTFRRIKNVRELEDGAHYVLAGYCAAHPDSLYVMASQDKTGTGKKNRAARKLALDYAQARRIDFTEIALPQGKSMVGDGKMPKGYVWTYVRKGEAGRLPEGWPNVVEIDRKDEGIQGNAVTRMVGCDSCTLGPKYSFTVPEETGIVWYRKVENDGGWLTVGLPYAVKKVAWEDADGETITSERLCFEEITGDGAVFREMEADEAWQAGMPYLWRPSEPRESVVCFYGEDTVVQPQESDVETTDGFYAVFGRYDIKDDGKTVFLLDDSGTRFVRAAAGSWVAPGRGYLVYTGTAFHSVRLIENELPAGAEGIETRVGGCLLPVYGTDGIKRGEICPGGHIPEEWPEGMYITPFGKMIKK